MKRILLITLVVVAVFGYFNIYDNKNSSSNQYELLEQLADEKKYKKFYKEIEHLLLVKDLEATKIMIDYFLSAVQNNEYKTVEYFLEQDRNLVNVEYYEDTKNKPLDIVLASDGETDIEMLKLLLKYKPDLEYEVKYMLNLSPLYIAIIGNNPQAIKLLIENGVSLDCFYVQNGMKVGPLSYAYMAKNNFKAFEELLKNGAYVDKRDDIINNILLSYVNIVKLSLDYLKKNESINTNKFQKIDYATFNELHRKNMKFLEEVFKYKTINHVDKESVFLLAKLFIMFDQMDGFDLLLKKGLCNIDNHCIELLNFTITNKNEKFINSIKGVM